MRYFISFLSVITYLFYNVLLSRPDYRLTCPNEIRDIATRFINSQDIENATVLSNQLRDFLVAKGYTFTQVSCNKNSGLLTIVINTGFLGKPSVSGNTYLSDVTVLKSLNWKSGKLFNYGDFHTDSTRLNRNRFVQVDTKLSPIRTDDGDIQVNADFSVEDKFPIIPFVKISNDGTDQSSGWRSTAGFELWDAIFDNDRTNLSYTLDPKDASQLSSYFGSYNIGSGRVSHTFYAGYSDSEYENIASSSLNMDIAGDGFFTGYQGKLDLSSDNSDTFALNFGLNYLDLGSQIYLGTGRLLASDQDLSLFLPKVGFQGMVTNPLGLDGKTFWSVELVSDLGSSDNAELKAQNPELERGFWVPKASFAFIEPVNILGIEGGIKLKVDGQSSNESLPTSLKKSLGGLSSVRGYREREAYGDSGVSMNFEYSLHSESSSLLGLQSNFQKIFFYDAGHVSNEGILSSANDSIGMQSFGAGIAGNVEDTANILLMVGVPITDTLNTKAHDTRTHFSINFRF